ncbi:unnamed protein product [Candida verbasci]|uniref:NAD(P)-binding domain-containing protein n=1 Tax=Candida verbasci TaxID=1227364 RepID=A0A9W4TXM7_9ASCO|nr:unnamed protein product [Candida verbasci]
MSESEYILVTGGAGYIGSHTVIELVDNGYKPIIVDNLSNSSYDAVSRIEFIVDQHFPFFRIDLRDSSALTKIFEKYNISSVIHFAALKAVGESTKIPIDYYDNNINGTINLVKVMQKFNVKTIVFSSSATVYGDVTRFGDDRYIPIPEECPMDPTNPYGKTKYMIEQILKDVSNSDAGSDLKVAILRYFNPIGAHPSGLLGENPLGIPNNLLPYLAQVAIGKREKLSIFGNDYASHDGTPIRDYIHVIDLAKGHIAALNYLHKIGNSGLYREWNLGTGKGSTVFDVYLSFCKAVGRELPYEVVARRSGDVLDLTAKPDRANEELQWKAELGIDEACKDLWKWTTENPFGFQIDNYQWKEFSDDLNDRLHTFKIDNFKVGIINYGATIQNIQIGDQLLVCGFDNGSDYKSSSNPYFGANIGRFANRIKHGKFTLNGKKYQLSQNEGDKNCLHSGFNGFDKQNWYGPIVKFNDDKFKVDFKLIDKDGNDGFPGDLETILHYIIGYKFIEIEYESKLLNGESTIVNLTNHSYFNISNGDSIDDTEFELGTDQYLKVDDELIPTGEIASIGSAKFTLTSDKSFDNCFIVNENDDRIDTRSNELKQLVKASHKDSKITLIVSSTDPAFQLYSGDGINTDGFKKRSGFCVEPSRFLNAINQPNWSKQVILKKDETYGGKIKYEFK